MSKIEGQSEWDIPGGLGDFVAGTYGLSKDAAESRAMYLFALGDILLAEDVGRSMNLNETQTLSGLVWNQWFDLELGSTKFQRFFDRTLRDHYSGVDKILDKYGGHITVEQAKEFRRRLAHAYMERSMERTQEFKERILESLDSGE